MLEESEDHEEELPIIDDDTPIGEPAYVAFSSSTSEPIHETQHYITFDCDPIGYGKPNATDANGNPCVELYFMRHMAKIVIDDTNMSDDDIVVMQVLLSGTKQAVIQRQTDVLNAEEFRKYPKELQSAILEELKIWVKHNCFEKANRQRARNIIDARFVAKWEIIKNPDGIDKRIIRMRMAVRGFKDWEAETLE